MDPLKRNEKIRQLEIEIRNLEGQLITRTLMTLFGFSIILAYFTLIFISAFLK